MRFATYSDHEHPEGDMSIVVADSYEALITKLFPDFEYEGDIEDADEQFEYAFDEWAKEHAITFDATYIDNDDFTDEEKSVILELARISLADNDIYAQVADQLDLADRYLFGLSEKIEKITNGVDIEY